MRIIADNRKKARDEQTEIQGLHQQTLTQLMMHPSSPMPGMPVARVPAPEPVAVTPNRDQHGSILPPGWAEVIDANSGRPIWVNEATDRVVFNQVSMYLEKPSVVDNRKPAARVVVPDSQVLSAKFDLSGSELARFFGTKIGNTKSTAVDLMSSSNNSDNSDNSNGSNDSDNTSKARLAEQDNNFEDLSGPTQNKMEAARTIAGLQLRQASDTKSKE